jgi:1-acyl-sn-glycerol-3-phosphate acyltransferase
VTNDLISKKKNSAHTTISANAIHGFLPNALQLGLGYLFLRPWVKFALRGRIRRSRYLPEGPLVLACNHRSFFDPPFVGMCFHRPIAYFAKASLWGSPAIAFMLRVMFGIPVDRDNPGLSSMKGAVERLRNGISVLVFAEGTRTRDGRLSPMREGPALFARRAGVPIVPVYLYRSEAVWPRGQLLPNFITKNIEVRIGSEIKAPSHLPSREQDAWISKRLALWMELQEQSFMGPRPQKNDKTAQ